VILRQATFKNWPFTRVFDSASISKKKEEARFDALGRRA